MEKKGTRDWTFLFDLDGTLTKKEILPEIARELGIEAEMAELTRQTIEGLIPFHDSFLRRVSLLKAVPISRIREIIEAVPLHEDLVQFVRENASRCCIVTGNLDVWVGPLCQRIGVRAFTSTADVAGNCITEVTHVLDKGTLAESLPGPLVAVGEGNNDAGMLRSATVGIAFGAVHSPARSVIALATHAIYEEEHLCRFLRQLSSTVPA